MASIRILKKDINKLAFDLLQECFSYRHYSEDLPEDRFDGVIRKIVYLRNDLIQRVNHPETDAEAVSIKAHYKKLQLDLLELVDVVEELKK